MDAPLAPHQEEHSFFPFVQQPLLYGMGPSIHLLPEDYSEGMWPWGDTNKPPFPLRLTSKSSLPSWIWLRLHLLTERYLKTVLATIFKYLHIDFKAYLQNRDTLAFRPKVLWKVRWWNHSVIQPPLTATYLKRWNSNLSFSGYSPRKISVHSIYGHTEELTGNGLFE